MADHDFGLGPIVDPTSVSVGGVEVDTSPIPVEDTPTPTDTGVRPEDGDQPTDEELDTILAALDNEDDDEDE